MTRLCLLRRWGRRSEPNLFGSTKSGRVFREELDGVDYDNDFIFELMSWNFEPSELGAAYGVVQLDKLEENYKTRKATFAAFTAAYGAHPEFFTTPVELDGLDTAWLCYPVMINENAPFTRSDLQEAIEADGIDTRTCVERQRHSSPDDEQHRVPSAGRRIAGSRRGFRPRNDTRHESRPA